MRGIDIVSLDFIKLSNLKRKCIFAPSNRMKMIREKLKEQMSDDGLARCFMHLKVVSWADEVMER